MHRLHAEFVKPLDFKVKKFTEEYIHVYTFYYTRVISFRKKLFILKSKDLKK